MALVAARLPARALGAALALGLLVLTACGDDGATASRESFEAEMVTRYGADPDQAACITDYVVADYDGDEVLALRDEGLGGLPQARWESYLSAAAACLTSEVLP